MASIQLTFLMDEPITIIRLEALRQTPLNDQPFPFVVIEKFLRKLRDLREVFVGGAA